jgi:hypothetical protein
MATLKPWVISEMAPRRRLRYFQALMLVAAKKAKLAGTITSGNYATIYGLYKKPSRVATSGDLIDVMDQVRQDIEGYWGACSRAVNKITITTSFHKPHNLRPIKFAANPPGGLTAGTLYYMTNVNATNNTFEVASTLAPAKAGTSLTLSSAGTSPKFYEQTPDWYPAWAWLAGATRMGYLLTAISTRLAALTGE